MSSLVKLTDAATVRWATELGNIWDQVPPLNGSKEERIETYSHLSRELYFLYLFQKRVAEETRKILDKRELIKTTAKSWIQQGHGTAPSFSKILEPLKRDLAYQTALKASKPVALKDPAPSSTENRVNAVIVKWLVLLDAISKQIPPVPPERPTQKEDLLIKRGARACLHVSREVHFLHLIDREATRQMKEVNRKRTPLYHSLSFKELVPFEEALKGLRLGHENRVSQRSESGTLPSSPEELQRELERLIVSEENSPHFPTENWLSRSLHAAVAQKPTNWGALKRDPGFQKAFRKIHEQVLSNQREEEAIKIIGEFVQKFPTGAIDQMGTFGKRSPYREPLLMKAALHGRLRVVKFLLGLPAHQRPNLQIQGSHRFRWKKTKKQATIKGTACEIVQQKLKYIDEEAMQGLGQNAILRETLRLLQVFSPLQRS